MRTERLAREARVALLTAALATSLLLGALGVVGAAEAREVGYQSFVSPHSQPLVVLADGSLLYVVNTPSATVDVLDGDDGAVVARIPVGLDPVGVAVRPDGREVWVSNHISDSVSVIDTDPSSRTHHHVIATVQEFDSDTRSTLFDEPVGIAFASNEKAYVALSSENRIAVVNVASRSVVDYLEIAAQDPRAITVRGNRLFAVPFESNNQTELSGCFGAENIDGEQCTFDLQEHVVDNNNVLSLGYDADIVRDPRVPDRDLFVFDTRTDQLVDVVSSVGTLLYGVTADSQGRVFISQTEARNDENGRAGTLKHELIDLENRAFLNQVAVVDCGGGSCSSPEVIELEPLPPSHPQNGGALATPFGIQISADDSTLVVTAAGSNKLFTVDASSGDVLGRVEVGWVPRGVALESAADGAPERAWVFNAVANSVSVVDVSRPSNPRVERTVLLDDPTDPKIKLGRFAFNDANASSTRTFSCASCHPDGHTDQLLWVLGGPQCEIDGCSQIPVRSTMPVRGLRDTAPYHWDGVQGDPMGGINGQFPQSLVEPNCATAQECIRHLIDGALGTTMCDQSDCADNSSGQAGQLAAEARSAMGDFLLSIPQPPARERPYDDQISQLARQGFFEFHDNGGRDTCGRCHQFPFWTNTNTPGSGMDAPSFRGLPDRWLILPQGRINMFELLSVTNSGSNDVPWNPNKGFDELSMWSLTVGRPENAGSNAANSGFGPLGPWQMFLEGSMGHSGALGRQVTLNSDTASSRATLALLDALERAAADGAIVLQGNGVRLDGVEPKAVAMVFSEPAFSKTAFSENALPIQPFSTGAYRDREGGGNWGRGQLLDLADAGELVLTLTAHLGPEVDGYHAQPGIWGAQSDPFNRLSIQVFPRLPDDNPMRIFGRHVVENASVFVNGRRVGGEVSCSIGGELPNCADEALLVRLDEVPAGSGMHLLQLQNPGGLMTNEFLFYTEPSSAPPPRSPTLPMGPEATNR